MSKQHAFIILLTIASIILVLFSEDRYELQWEHNTGKFNPVHAYKREINVLGEPDLLDDVPGGLAIWRQQTLEARKIPLVEIILRDESVPHLSPAPHNDFLYATYKLDIPRDRISDVLKLSDSITYDPLKGEITVRCHFMGANYATLYLSTLITDETLGIDVAKNMYGPAIMQTIPSHETYNEKSEQEYIDHLALRLDN